MEKQQWVAGQTIFVPSAEEGFSCLTIGESRGFGANISIKATPISGGGARALNADELENVVDADHLALGGAPDVVKLLKLSEAALLHNLRVRYARDEMYTRAGSILISVNPFKPLSIYTPEKMRQAKACAWRPPADRCALRLPP